VNRAWLGARAPARAEDRGGEERGGEDRVDARAHIV